MQKYTKIEKNILLELENETEEIDANRRTMPGMLTHRGCCYAGCKGVVLGPIKDIVVLTHGPIGCGYYSWGTRRNKASVQEGEMEVLFNIVSVQI